MIKHTYLSMIFSLVWIDLFCIVNLVRTLDFIQNAIFVIFPCIWFMIEAKYSDSMNSLFDEIFKLSKKQQEFITGKLNLEFIK